MSFELVNAASTSYIPNSKKKTEEIKALFKDSVTAELQ